MTRTDKKHIMAYDWTLQIVGNRGGVTINFSGGSSYTIYIYDRVTNAGDHFFSVLYEDMDRDFMRDILTGYMCVKSSRTEKFMDKVSPINK